MAEIVARAAVTPEDIELVTKVFGRVEVARREDPVVTGAALLFLALLLVGLVVARAHGLL